MKTTWNDLAGISSVNKEEQLLTRKSEALLKLFEGKWSKDKEGRLLMTKREAFGHEEVSIQKHSNSWQFFINTSCWTSIEVKLLLPIFTECRTRKLDIVKPLHFLKQLEPIVMDLNLE